MKNVDAMDGMKISMALFFISNYDFIIKGVEGVDRRMVYLPYLNPLERPGRV